MRRAAVIGGGVVGVALLVWLAVRLNPSDRVLIRRQLESVARLASFDGTESPLVRLAAANRILDRCKTNIVINLQGVSAEGGNIEGHDQLRPILLASRTQLRQLQVRFVDDQVNVEPGASTATVVLTALADVDGEKNTGIQILQFRMERIGGEWLIAHVDTIEVLRR